MSKNNENKLVPKLRFPEFLRQGDWKKKALKNVAGVTMGSSPSSTKYNENKIGLPLLQGNADIKNRLSAPRIYTSEITKECQIDDILLSVRAPVGTVAKSLHNACIGRGIAAIKAIDKNSQEYLYQWLISNESAWKNISQGGTFDAVNSDDVRNLLLPIPLPEEQQKIIACLSSLDKVITAESQKLEVLKEHKKGLLQNLFPQLSESGFSGLKNEQDKSGKSYNYVNPDSDNVPKVRFKEFEDSGDWVEKKLGEVAIKVGSGSTPLGGESVYKKVGRPFVRSQNVGWGIFLLENIAFIDEETHQNSINTEIQFEDVLLNITGASIGRSAVANEFVTGGNVNQHVCIIRTEKDILNPVFLNQFIISDFGQKQIDSFQAGGNRQGLNFVQIRSLSISIPPTIQEQQKIASCLSSIDELIITQSQKLETLQLHKKGLLQGLFPNVNPSNSRGLESGANSTR
jgi:type I restriction enzyme S subunit